MQRLFHIKTLSAFAGPLSFVMLMIFRPGDVDHLSWNVAAVASWMLIWWLSETVNLAVTSLLPLVLFPLLDVLPMQEVAANYANPLVYLFFGGFVIALALEKWNLHKRMALYVIQFTGIKTTHILLGFMLATAFLSMWISNTATTVMMLPIALSVIHIMDQNGGEKFPAVLLIAIAWSANIGGMATLIGTPPNLILAGFMKEEFFREIGFTEWLIIGLPVSIALLFFSFLLLLLFIPANERKWTSEDTRHYIQDELKKLGKLKTPEKRVLMVFTATAMCWIFREQLIALTGLKALSDTGIAIMAAILLFLIPGQPGSGGYLLEWRDTEKLSWGILLLFGGGLALASGIQHSGWVNQLGTTIGESGFSDLFWLILILTSMGVFLTEIISNMALVSALLPLVAAIAIGVNQDFYKLALPVTLGASCAFMLPMATPPNAIVFSSERIKIATMAKFGLIINLISVGVISVFVYWLV